MSNLDTPRAMISVAELAAALGVSVKSIQRRVADGTLPAPTRIGRLIRWPIEILSAIAAL